MTSEGCDFIEHITTPLNACSLETLPDPTVLMDGSKKWPLMLGCYELDEATGKRLGRLDFYTVSVPNKGNRISGLGIPTRVNGLENAMTGVLDGKWYQDRLEDDSLIYATAHASGEIAIHKIEQRLDHGFKISQAGKSERREDSGLCLALAWDLVGRSTSTTRIISSYSDGKVSIHQANVSQQKVELVETETWDAHKMFRSPAEVWCANFTSETNVVMSGGDEGTLKIWDLRAGLSSPMQVLKNFEAGVTVLSPHPRVNHLVACGSYDETVAIFDLRYGSQSKPKVLCHSDALGGGIWRIKWHPFDDAKLLLGAMHGGCRVVCLDGLESAEQPVGSVSFRIQQEFTNHESMAYGADWLACKDMQVDAAASCSFYDRALYLWEVQSP